MLLRKFIGVPPRRRDKMGLGAADGEAMAETDSTYEFKPKEEPAEAPRAVPTLVPPEELIERCCPHCGFKVVGRPRRGRCPECNGAILDTSLADMLQFSGAPWVRTRAVAAFLLALAVPLHIAGAVGMWMEHTFVGEAAHAAAAVLIALGAWIVTARDNEGTRRRYVSMGLTARVATLAAAGFWITAWALVVAGHAASLRGIMVAALLIMAIEAVGLCVYLYGLTGRIPSDGLATQFYFMAWVIPVVCAILIAAQYANVPALMQLLFFSMIPLTGCLIGILGWVTSSLVRLGLELRSVAATADAIAIKRELRAQQQAKKPPTEPHPSGT
jgi:hypothetical protein